jgi:glycosyltransferase involved in cell wall biosynthesis
MDDCSGSELGRPTLAARAGLSTVAEENAVSRAPGTPPALSVVIPTYNDGHCLELTLRSLARQTLATDQFEVIVVHDGPTQANGAAKPYVDALNITDLDLPERRGRSAARNAGLAAAIGRFVVFLDADCYADRDLLARHLAFQGESRGPRVLLGRRYEIDLPHLGHLIRDEAIPAELLDSAEYGDQRFIGADDAGIETCLRTPWLFAHSNNASVPSDVLAAVGGFNEDFGIRWGWEDLELFYRVHRHVGGDAGRFVYDPETVCYHLPQYRDMMSDYADFFANESMVKRLHPHLDWEFHSLRLPATVAAKVRYYRELVHRCAETGTGRLVPVRDWLERRLAHDEIDARKVLWIGAGTRDVAARAAAMTFDYGVPPSEANLHLIGTAIPAAVDEFDAVISVDIWRFLQWSDLCDFVREATRVARRLILVRTASADVLRPPVASDDDLEYVCRALAPHYKLEVNPNGSEVSDITVRRRGVAAVS